MLFADPAGFVKGEVNKSIIRTGTTTSLQTLSAYNSSHDRKQVTGVHLTGISSIPAPVIIYMHLKQDFCSTLRKDDAVEILIS